MCDFQNPVTTTSAGRRVALVGHSGAGKSACLEHLGIDRATADMDAVFGTQAEEMPQLEAALAWLADGTTERPIVVVSNHERLLRAMPEAKCGGRHREEFARILFLYLHKQRDRLQRHLARPIDGGRRRPLDAQRYTLGMYRDFDHLFRHLADRTLEVADRQTADVAAEVRLIAEAEGLQPLGDRS
jgi:hypothetical protein